MVKGMPMSFSDALHLQSSYVDVNKITNINMAYMLTLRFRFGHAFLCVFHLHLCFQHSSLLYSPLWLTSSAPPHHMQRPDYSLSIFVSHFEGWRKDGRFYCLVEIAYHLSKRRQLWKWFEKDFGKAGDNENNVACVPSC
jgi:hypothetical protein